MREWNEIRTNNNDPYSNSAEQTGSNGCSEFSDAAEHQPVNEIGSLSASSSKAKKAASAISALLSSAAVLAVIALGIGDIFSPTSPAISHMEFQSTGSAIYYSVALESYSEGSTLTVEVYNDFIRQTDSTDESSISGKIYDLKPDMYYTVNVLYDGQVIHSERLLTTDQHEQSVSGP